MRWAENRARRLSAGLFVGLIVAALLLGLAEVGLRIAGRVGGGAWPRTRAAVSYDRVLQLQLLCRHHAFLNTSPRGGVTVTAPGKSAVMNQLGYRSPERSRSRPAGTLRVLVAGGSTTFDSLARDNADTWPSRLEGQLRAEHRDTEVWNAGFPAWTSLESMISLAIRDLDLDPDLTIFFHGINDLQPASHEPFDPQYEAGHAEISRRALGLDTPAPAWLERSLVVEALKELVHGLTQPWRAQAGTPVARRREEISAESVAVFERNVRSFAALARSRGAALLLVTQPLRIRQEMQAADLAGLAEWYPELAPQAAPRELERLNQVLRNLAGEGVGELADAAQEIDWADRDFGDPVHYTETGRSKLAGFLAPRVAALLAQRQVGRGRPRS